MNISQPCVHLSAALYLSVVLKRRNLYKFADVAFEIPPGDRPFRPHDMHEPLVLGLTLRFIHCSPWILQ